LKSKGSCGYNISKPTTFLCYYPDNTSHPIKCPGRGIVTQNSSYASDVDHRNKNKTAIIIGSSIGGVALIAITLVLFLVYCLKNRKLPGIADYFRRNERKGMEGYVPGHEIGKLPIFSYEELRHATNGFHEENELGVGGFGSVYLGKLQDGRTVAIKRLYQDNVRRVEQFLNEVDIFSSLNHPQLVRLFGCTNADSPELLLVYEFVPNGTLADHLHGDRKCPEGLPWNIRFNIAIQTAQALAFLHGVDPPIFHRDVKSSNILLDENFNVKVADFGLCRLVPVDASHVTTIPQGTPGYIDPEYYQCYQLTGKSDVYSFGVVLVEIISAKIAMDINRNRREINLANLAITKIQEGALHQLVDPQLDIEVNHEVKVMVTAVAELAFRCLASERDDRPDMKEVVAELEVITGLWSACPNPDEHWGSFPNSKEPLSPTSVQDNWPSINSSPNYST
jgi:serine/threonine protein kinase